MIRAAIEPSPTAGDRGSGGSQEVEADEPAKAVVSVSNTEFTGNPPYSISPYSSVGGGCAGWRAARCEVMSRRQSVLRVSLADVSAQPPFRLLVRPYDCGGCMVAGRVPLPRTHGPVTISRRLLSFLMSSTSTGQSPM